jgi:hypothetical protein
MERRWRWCGYGSGLIAAVMALAGCGPGHGMTLGRVQGKVTYKGEPVKYGTVSFVADTSKGTNGPIAMGNIKEDGTYVLSTSDPGDGAVVGHHKISVVGLDPMPVKKTDDQPVPTPDESPGEFMKNKAKAVEQAHRAPRRRAAAKAAEQGDTFSDRGGRVFRYVVPKKLGVAEESGLETDVARGSNTIDIQIAEDGTARIVK